MNIYKRLFSSIWGKSTELLPKFKLFTSVCGLSGLAFVSVAFADHEEKKCRVCRSLGGNNDLDTLSMHDFLKLKPLAQAKAAAGSDISYVQKMSKEEYNEHFKGYKPPVECPPNYWELGQSTWNYLHTMAAYYPEEPSDELQKSMPNFIKTFAQIYPCHSCSEHMLEYIEKHPPQVRNNSELSLWFCELHNDVNHSLGKPPVPCDTTYLFERWRDGPEDGRCD